MLALLTEESFTTFGDYEFISDSCVMLNGEFGSYLVESVEAPNLKETLEQGMPTCGSFPYLYDLKHGPVAKNFTRYAVPVIIHAKEPYELSQSKKNAYRNFAYRLSIVRGLLSSVSEEYDEYGEGMRASVQKLVDELL